MSSPLRIALISEHASPLAPLGGTDAGGQNVYAAHVARCLAAKGHEVDVLTRRDAPQLPAAVDVRPGMRVLHIDAGPATHMPKPWRVAARVLSHDVPCRDCLMSVCPHGHHDCLMKVEPDDVVHAALSLLRTRPHEGSVTRTDAREPQFETQGSA
jgi:glycosyl transferase family 4